MKIIDNMPAAEYHAVDACSHSRLVAMRRSAAYCRYRMLNPESSDAMTLGSALHCRVLEDLGTFGDRFAIAIECDRRTKEGKIAWADFQAGLGNREIISRDDMAKVSAMSASIAAHPAASAIVKSPGRNELSLFWEWDGVPCRARLDMVRSLPGLDIVADLKTCRDASPDGFPKSVVNFGYHIQAAFYLRGAAACGLGAEKFAFICVESEPPHLVAVYQIGDEAVAQGDRECQKLIAQYKECHLSGVWPGYSDEPVEIGLPNWAKEKEHV